MTGNKTFRDKNAPYYRGQELLKAGRNEEARNLYRMLAHDGDPNSQVFYGWMLYEGLGGNRERAEAFEWFRRAASVGSSRGAFFCGKHLLADKKHSDAIPFLRDSASKKFSPAVLWLGICYINGWGVERDIPKGMRFVEEASQLGNWMAKRKLASLKMSGHYGVLGIIEGVAVLPYVIVGGVLRLFIFGYSEELMG